MTMLHDIFYNVLRQIRAQQERAFHLNSLAGEEIFAVLQGDELLERVRQALKGARRMSEVDNLGQLAGLILPPIDEEKAAEVEAASNGRSSYERSLSSFRYDERHVELASKRYRVHEGWRDNGLYIEIYADSETDLSRLPDVGVFLEGKAVEVHITIGYTTTERGTNIAELKKNVRDKYIEDCLKRWFDAYNYNRPECSGDEVVEHPVCRDPVTGQPVYAYGTVRLSSGKTTTCWFKTREEAERQQAAVQASIDARKGKDEKKDGLKEQAYALNQQLCWISAQCQGEELPAPAGTQAPLLEAIQSQRQQFRELNFNRVSQVTKWIEAATVLITRGNNTILRQSAILKKAIENLFELTLSLIPESEQNEQIERLDALEKLIGKSAPVGSAELLGVAAKMVLDAT
jgi:hypothetical protein